MGTYAYIVIIECGLQICSGYYGVPVDIRVLTEEMIEVITEPELRHRTGIQLVVCIKETLVCGFPGQEMRTVAVVIMVHTDAGSVGRERSNHIQLRHESRVSASVVLVLLELPVAGSQTCPNTCAELDRLVQSVKTDACRRLKTQTSVVLAAPDIGTYHLSSCFVRKRNRLACLLFLRHHCYSQHHCGCQRENLFHIYKLNLKFEILNHK